MSKAKWIIDYSLYVLIGIGVALSGIAFAYYAKPTTPFPVRWIWLACATALLFGQTIAFFRRRWAIPRFWMVVGLLFLLHVAIYAVLFAKYERVPLLLLGVSLVPEFFAFSLVITRLTDE